MSDRPAHLRALVKEVAERLGIPADSREARHVALMYLVDEAYQARAVAGHLVPIADLLKLDEALQPYMPKPAEPEHKLEIVAAQRLVGVCQKCGHHQDVGSLPPPERTASSDTSKPADVVSTGEAPAAEATTVAGKQYPRKPFSRPPGEVVEMPKKRPNIHDGYEQEFGDLRSDDPRYHEPAYGSMIRPGQNGRQPMATYQPRDPYIGGFAGIPRQNPFAHYVAETNPNHATPPVPPVPKESA